MPDDSIFLTTTALRELWNTDNKIIFIDEGCKRYSQKKYWEYLNHQTLVPPWHDDRTWAYNAFTYVNRLIDKMFTHFSDALNQVHKTNYSDRYWRTVTGFWFRDFVSTIYYKTTLLERFIKSYPDFTTILLDESCYVTPHSFHKYHVGLIQDDFYNAQLYSQIITEMGYRSETKSVVPNIEIDWGINYSYKRLLTKARQFMIYNVYLPTCDLVRTNKDIAIQSLSTPSRSTKMKFSLLMSANSSNYVGNHEELNHQPIIFNNPDFTLRDSVKLSYVPENKFEEILLRLLFRNIPAEFLERYRETTERSHEIYRKSVSPKLIVSGVAWFEDTYFNHWAAACREKYGTVLIGGQHGGLNGSIQLSAEEFFSPDGYMTWGYDVSFLNEEMSTDHLKYNIKAAVKLFSQKKLKLRDEASDILLVGACASRFGESFLQVKYIRDYHLYLESQYRFIDSFSGKYADKLLVRVRNFDYGWDVIQRFNDNYPNLRLDLWKRSFNEALDDCRICVVDNIGTTYVEALHANKPTILFWGEDEGFMTTAAAPYYKKLHDAGILHYTPESAAAMIESVYDNVNEWWMEPERQAVVNEFCRTFAYVPPNPLRFLKKELNNILAGTKEKQ